MAEELKPCPFWEGEVDCETNGYIEFTNKDIGKTVFLCNQDAEE